MIRLRRILTAILKSSDPPGACDACAFVDFFRSNGDGQSARLQGFCRCPHGPFHDRPLPRARRCDAWEQASERAEKPQVGDPNLTV